MDVQDLYRPKQNSTN